MRGTLPDFRRLPDADAACDLCPRRCGALRASGRHGYCGAGAAVRLYRFGPHHGEEPPISGTRGSGAVFFGRCTMRCLYCQNYPWSQEGAGRDCTAAELADILLKLRDAGCHNWNLVSPTPWLHEITAALRQARAAGAQLPVVYNTGGFERVETIRALAGQVAVYLADLRYASDDTARAASDAPEYVAVARGALMEMRRQTGALRVDADGIAVSGLICRILVLPGRADEACASLDWLARDLGVDTAVSIMSQYVPAYRALQCAGWDRRITLSEYDTVCRHMEQLGFINGWVQDYDSKYPEGLLGFNMPPE